MVFKKREVEESVLELAQQRVAHAFDRFDRISVSFSGGKDSTVALNLALEEAERRGRLPLDVVFFDEEALQPATIEYVERVRNDPRVAMRWFCLPVQCRNACSRRQPYWFPWAEEDKHLWCREKPECALDASDLPLPGFNRHDIPTASAMLFDPSVGTVGQILGIRAQESLRRYRSVMQRRYENYISNSTLCPYIYSVKPIYDWSTEDVWTYPEKTGCDYNRSYDAMAQVGIPITQQRVCPPYGEEPLGGLWIYAQCWPELWDKMTARVQGAATAGRYSRSPLYSFRIDGVSKPDDVSWQEFIKRAVEKWPLEYQPKVAHSLKVQINYHNENTTDPIREDAHPDTGVGWKMLYVIASRGDLKRRRGEVRVFSDKGEKQ